MEELKQCDQYNSKAVFSICSSVIFGEFWKIETNIGLMPLINEFNPQ
jgi:hypothetical protein